MARPRYLASSDSRSDRQHGRHDLGRVHVGVRADPQDLAGSLIVGNNVISHAGAVIGADGFGFVRDGDRYVKFPQVGRVVIADDVEIGANTCIDRGSLETTVIRRGVKPIHWILSCVHRGTGIVTCRRIKPMALLRSSDSRAAPVPGPASRIFCGP